MRLLLVEDQADLAANVADHLAGLGHDVQLCADGETAFSAARNGHFDMLILDVMLPRLDGLSVCRALRQEGLEQLPILMLTARDTVADRVAGLDAGADDYLVKPFALAELEARVRALLRRVQPAPNAAPELLQNTQRVVTRQELEAALWGDSPPTGDVLRAHMYALRVAVDKPFDRKLLHTVHGEGYRLTVLDEA